MRLPWSWATGWGEQSNKTAVENARMAAVECSRALVERIEIELYVAALHEQRVRQMDGEQERPSVIA